MAEITPKQAQLLEELKAAKHRSRTRNAWWQGFVFGGLAVAIFVSALLFGYVMPKVKAAQVSEEAARISSERAIFDATTQRQACQARFQRSTVLWDSATAPSQKLPLFNGLINLTPGQALGGGEQAAPAWFVPADVPIVFYGDAAHAQVLTIDRQGNIISRTQPLTIAQVRANPSLLKLQD